MRDRAVLLAALVILASSCAAYCETISGEEFNKRWNDLEKRKNAVIENYKYEMDKLSRATDEKLAMIKKDFHAKRDVCLKEKSDQEKALLNNYKDKIDPLKDEERQLVAMRGVAEPMNFAKSKIEREIK